MKTWADVGIILNTDKGQTKTLCPVCSEGRTKSDERCLSVDIDNQVWNCHHCGWVGSLKNSGKSFTAPDNGTEKVAKWFETRGIPEHIVAAEYISISDKGFIAIPYVKYGQVVNIKYRSMKDKSFSQEKDAEQCLYRFDKIATHEEDMLIITEGCIDCLSFIVAGYKSVTSVPCGAPSTQVKERGKWGDFLNSASEILKGYKKVLLAMDTDEPGRNAFKELARRIGPEKCYSIEYPEGCKDANDVLLKHSEFALIDAVNKAKPLPIEGIIRPSDVIGDLLDLYNGKEERGISTGWFRMDKYYTIKPGQMTIVVGIPGGGKTTWMDALVVNLIANENWRFAMFSPENWPVAIHVRTIIEKRTMKSFKAGLRYTDRMTEQEIRDTAKALDNNISFFSPKPGKMQIKDILNLALIEVKQRGINGIVIDPWNEVEHDYKNLTETQYISETLAKIRQFARRHQVHIWVVAHPKNLVPEKDGTFKAPTMYHISGGANWRNKADNGICIYRPDMNQDVTEVIIQKIRFRSNGRLGKVMFRFSRETETYTDFDDDNIIVGN